MLTREDVIEKLKNGELTPQDIAANGWMCSVTQRISKIKQPRGGYIKPGAALMTCIQRKTYLRAWSALRWIILLDSCPGLRPKRRLRFPSWVRMLFDSWDCSSSCCRM